MIYYLLVFVAGIIALLFLALFVTQFWRLGQYLKLKHPIVFRIYASIWYLFGFIAAILIIFLIGDLIKSKKICSGKTGAVTAFNACFLSTS